MKKLDDMTDRQLVAERRSSVEQLRRSRCRLERASLAIYVGEIDDVLSRRNVVVVPGVA